MSDAEARAFLSRYRRGVARPGAAILLFPLLLAPGAALFKNLLAGLVVAAFGLLASLYVSRLLSRARPALKLSGEGARIDGLPPLPWTEIASVRRDPDSRDGANLVVRLSRGFGALGATALRSHPLWRPIAEDVFILHAALLEDPPGEVEGAFRYFMGR